MSDFSAQIESVVDTIRTQEAYLIGITGYPGSGKSSLAQELSTRLDHSVVVPMDGYHLYRHQLDQHGLRFRGADFTIDLPRMQQDLLRLKTTRHGSFPAFSHENKDPVENAIQVHEHTKYVIVEGLYILMHHHGMAHLMDIHVYVDCPEHTILTRLVKRHIASGICHDEQEATLRVQENDIPNGRKLREHSQLDRAMVVKSG